MSNSLGVDKTFLNVLKTRYQANLESNDSLRAQFEQLYGQSSNSIAYGDDTRKVLRTLFLSGFYIEGLYSMFEIIENYPKDILPDDQRVMILIPVAKAILSQEDNIVNLHEMLKENVYEKFDSQSFQFWFEDLIKTYQKLDVQAKIMNNQGGELLNDQVFNELKEKVEVIRTQIVAKP